ncbi:Acyl-CoA N-acyltransferase [Beauveria brongniartii RCEF 3172]|uniref:Acyl-CoA N-acyltransferase n=1 Tax=Beauveria brongniartii RCEF 3172 TaxID=1081107 RepID=A0A166XJP8_9HYPO|nr:Acyl-CoA N-acyltransferase [Beauveria brongniartii RCEF 3172]
MADMSDAKPPAGIIIRPGTAADADAISQVHYEALDRFHAFYATFFKKHPRELIPIMTSRAFAETRRPVQVFYVAEDEDEGDVVGFVRYSIEEAKTEDDKKGMEEVKGKKEESPFACKEALKEVWNAFGEEQAKRDAMLEDAAKGQRHMCIQHLMIRPSHQRQGIGHALLARALLRADAARLPAVIVSSAESKGLYGKAGFASLGSFRLDNGRWAREAARVLAGPEGRGEEEEEGDHKMLVERYDGVFEVEDVMVRAVGGGREVEQV